MGSKPVPASIIWGVDVYVLGIKFFNNPHMGTDDRSVCGSPYLPICKCVLNSFVVIPI